MTARPRCPPRTIGRGHAVITEGEGERRARVGLRARQQLLGRAHTARRQLHLAIAAIAPPWAFEI